MSQAELMWECSCGHVEYSEVEPEECLKCGNLSTFMQMPEEIVDEREKEMAEEELAKSVKVAKVSKSKVSKVKTKSGRKKSK